MFPKKLLRIVGNKPGGYVFLTIQNPRPIYAGFLFNLADNLGEIVLDQQTRNYLADQSSKEFWGRDSITVNFAIRQNFRAGLFVLGLHHVISDALWIRVIESEESDRLVVLAADGEKYYRSAGYFVKWNQSRLICLSGPDKIPPMITSFANQLCR